MKKIFTSQAVSVLFVAMALLVSSSVQAAERVALWNSDGQEVAGFLSSDWVRMTQVDLENFVKEGLVSLDQGDLACGFQFKADAGENLEGAYIFVIVQQGEKIPGEQIQKTYLWFQKNSALMSGVLPSEVSSMNIENIEYRQDKATILFQTKMAMADKLLAGVSGIVFTEQGYINIIAFVEEKKLPDFADQFYSFITTLSLPETLWYRFPESYQASKKQNVFIPWLMSHWERIIGVLLIGGVYGAVFIRKRQD